MIRIKKLAKPKLATAMSLMLAFAASTAVGQTVSVKFQGRINTDSSNPATDPLAASEVAGVLPVANWNNIDNAYNGDSSITDFSANVGTTAPLVDSTGAATPITLTFSGNDSWFNDVPASDTTTPNTKMMNGSIKRQGAGTSLNFTYNNLVDGQYDVYVYFTVNNDNVRSDISDGNFTKTFYAIEQHRFTTNDTFVEVTSTDPNAPQFGNYVHFTNLATYGATKLSINAKYISGGDGNSVVGMQLVKVGGPVGLPPAPVLVSNPSKGRYLAGETPTLSATIAGAGLTLQWYKNDNIIQGANASTYTLPALTAADNGARFYLKGSNVSGSTNSEVAVITIGNKVKASAVKRQFYSGRVRADLDDETAPLTPDFTEYRPSFEAPLAFGNNYAQRLTTTFIAPENGNYVFFINSDDDSDLYVSTDATAANKVLVASEPLWSDSRNWVSTANRNAEAPENRSDNTFGTITMVKGSKYYIEARHHEGGGGDNLAVTYKLDSESDPANGSAPRLTGSVIETDVLDGNIVEITTPPSNQSAQENRKASFSATAVSSQIGGTLIPEIFYQWQGKAPSAGAFTNINGATKNTYTTGLLSLADNGTKIRLVATVIGFSTNSVEANLEVVPDTFAPLISDAGSLKTMAGVIEIGVGFDEELDPTTAAAPGNYQISKGTISSVRFEKYANTFGAVALATTGLSVGDSVTVTVTGVKDLKGNTMPATTKTLTVKPRLTRARVGGTDYVDRDGESLDKWPTDAVAVGDNDYTLVSGGSADWGSYEEMSFAYEIATNDFDKVVRVEYQDPTSQWARAGLQVRAALDNDKMRSEVAPEGEYVMSRNVQLRVNPVVQWNGAAGNNAYEFIYRAADDPALQYAGPGNGNPQYPDAWMRLKREGQKITGFRSADGVNWTEVGNYTFIDDAVLPTNTFVGVFYSPEFGNNGTKDGVGHSAHARFKDYMDFGTVVANPMIVDFSLTGGSLTIHYSGGTLQSTTSLNPPIVWTDEGTSGTYNAPAGATEKYFRVKQ